MSRQSISFTQPNDEWLAAQVDSREYSSKSEVINDLIRKAREIEYIRARLIKAELNGFSRLTPEEIIQKSKCAAKEDGEL